MGLQNIEYLMNLDHDEIALLRRIDNLDRLKDVLPEVEINLIIFRLTDEIIKKIAKGELPIDFRDYHKERLGDFMIHGDSTQFQELIDEVGNYLFKKMYNPEGVEVEKREKLLEGCTDFA
jgi:hypothetical protein